MVGLTAIDPPGRSSTWPVLPSPNVFVTSWAPLVSVQLENSGAWV